MFEVFAEGPPGSMQIIEADGVQYNVVVPPGYQKGSKFCVRLAVAAEERPPSYGERRVPSFASDSSTLLKPSIYTGQSFSSEFAKTEMGQTVAVSPLSFSLLAGVARFLTLAPLLRVSSRCAGCRRSWVSRTKICLVVSRRRRVFPIRSASPHQMYVSTRSQPIKCTFPRAHNTNIIKCTFPRAHNTNIIKCTFPRAHNTNIIKCTFPRAHNTNI
jgi:hypothetical protein